MKKITLALFLLFSSFSFIQAQCIRDAIFQDGPDYTLDGTATLTFLSNGTKTLSFNSEFTTPYGPDLHVYLSQSATVSTPGGQLQTPNTIELGLLKNNVGSQSYDLSGITPSVDIDSYEYVIIHCKDFDHYWGTGTFGTKSGTECGNLSVAAIEDESIAIYPTIVKNNKIIIELKNNQTASLFLYSLLGELVQEPLLLSEEKNIIETRSLTSGIYILQLDFGNKIRTQKIIIE